MWKISFPPDVVVSVDKLYQLQLPVESLPAFEQDMLYPIDSIIMYWDTEYTVTDREGNDVIKHASLWAAPDIYLVRQVLGWNGAHNPQGMGGASPTAGTGIVWREEVKQANAFFISSEM